MGGTDWVVSMQAGDLDTCIQIQRAATSWQFSAITEWLETTHMLPGELPFNLGFSET